jgi:monovalent cation/proton antiporter MnhG/PhaG subunit
VSPRLIVEAVLLALVVLSCWVGALGMWRMREPMQALHYLSLPACVGAVALTAAVFVRTGNTQASWKTVIITFVLLAINSVVTHATARAFRTRDLGHWQPLPGDDVERVPRAQERGA